jgi:hypothetical protein
LIQREYRFSIMLDFERPSAATVCTETPSSKKLRGEGIISEYSMSDAVWESPTG